jgi:hypothetical protein
MDPIMSSIEKGRLNTVVQNHANASPAAPGGEVSCNKPVKAMLISQPGDGMMKPRSGMHAARYNAAIKAKNTEMGIDLSA